VSAEQWTRCSAGSLVRSGATRDLLDAVRSSPHLNMDETGWRLQDHSALCGHVHRGACVLPDRPDRHEDHAKTLLADTKAIVTSDRWCLCHLPLAPADLLGTPAAGLHAHAEGLAEEQRFGQLGLES